jgi:L1 cell adhesion molecule like protein
VKEFKRKHKQDLRTNERSLKRLKNACERAKRTLSSSTQTLVQIDSLYDGIDFNSTLTRARFEDLCADFFRQTLEPVERVLRDAKLDKRSVDEVVLVGGSTRIPKVQKLLSQFFGGKELCQSINADEAVAYGAAVQAAILGGTKDDELKEMVLVDVCPLSLGIETAGGVMTKIVERQSQIPCSKKQTFSTYSDNQSAVNIQVYEGERTMTRDNNLLGRFDLQGIPPMPRGVPKIEVKFEIDTNGIMNVTAEEISTKNKRSITITNDKGRLSNEEIEQMIKDAEKYAAEDQAKREVIEGRQKLESFAYSARNSLNDPNFKEKLDEADQKTANQCVNDTLDWLDNNENATFEEVEAQQKEAEGILHPILAKAYQGASGDGAGGMPNMPGGMPNMPGGMPNMPGGPPPQPSTGPTVEELD